MTIYTKRYIIIARADLAQKANIAANKNDTDPIGGDRAFTVGLSTSGNLPIQAYWCNWALRPAQALAIRNRLIVEGATIDEVTPVPFGQNPVSNRFAVFDVSDGWTPELVLQTVSLKTIKVF